jgi:hypothetical protein
MIRSQVAGLIAKGPMSSSSSGVDQIKAWQETLGKIAPPLSDDEAAALTGLFPTQDEDCFGLAWSLIHLIETAPHWPLERCLADSTNPWVLRLRQRASV